MLYRTPPVPTRLPYPRLEWPWVSFALLDGLELEVAPAGQVHESIDVDERAADVARREQRACAVLESADCIDFTILFSQVQ